MVSVADRTGGRKTLRGVEVFSTGKHRDQEYTHQKLDEMVANFERFSKGPGALVRPPVVIGHEENQPLLKNSGIPKMGQPSRLWREDVTCRLCNGSGISPEKGERAGKCRICCGTGRQGLLKADLDGLPAKIRRLIKARRYDSVSAEVYSRPPAGVPGEGAMLRRIAILGGELPQIKSLAELPDDFDDSEDHEEFGEEAWRPARLSIVEIKTAQGGAFESFFEVCPMTREELVAALAAKGWNKDILATLPEGALAECERFSECGPKGEPTDEDWKKMPPEEGAKKYGEHCRDKTKAYLERGKKLFGDNWSLEDDSKPKDQKAMNFSEEQMDKIVAAVTAKLTTGLNDVRRDIDTFKESTKKAAISEFIESRLKAGKISPREMDKPNGRPNLFDQLFALDSSTVVHKFSENGKEKALTALDLAMDNIDARPSLFSEKFKQPGTGSNNSTLGKDEAELAEVERFFESHSDELGKVGFTKAEFVETYKKTDAKERAQLLADFK